MHHPPAYDEYANKPKPKWYWETPDGSWVGVWGYDWADLIGINVTKASSDISYEVWQPDNRADKLYEAEIARRVMHKQFPAVRKSYWFGLHKRRYWFSKAILKALYECNGDNTILVLSTSHIHLTKQMVGHKLKILHVHFINTKLLLPIPLTVFNPVRFLHRFLYNIKQRNIVKSFKYLVTENTEGTDEIKSINPIVKVYNQRWEIDLAYWQRNFSKQEARNALKIPKNQYIFVLSQRLVPEYQIDKLIRVISQLRSNKDFRFIITGHGKRDYEAYLKDMVEKNGLQEKVSFVGYVSEEDLKKYMIAANIFMTVPIMFAGSVGAIKAMCLETPVFHVSEGSTYELLKQHDAGLIVSPTSYEQWKNEIESLLDGKVVKTVPRSFLEEHYNWKNIANDWLNIFFTVIEG